MTAKNFSFVFGASLILSLTIGSCSGQGDLTEMSASEME